MSERVFVVELITRIHKHCK